jgi:hypothetical protein
MKLHWLVVLSAAFMVTGVYSGAPISSGETTRAETTDFSSQTRQRPRVRVTPNQPAAYDYPRPGDYSWPGPGAVRQCVDWYATEYRPSGTVITPQMRCRWVRG